MRRKWPLLFKHIVKGCFNVPTQLESQQAQLHGHQDRAARMAHLMHALDEREAEVSVGHTVIPARSPFLKTILYFVCSSRRRSA